MNAQTIQRIRYEDGRRSLLSSETVQYLIQLGGTTFAGLVVIIVAMVTAKALGAV